MVPAAALLLHDWAGAGLSWWSAVLGAGLGLLALGSVARGLSWGDGSRLFGAGAALVLVPWLVRSFVVTGTERARLTVLPDDTGSRLVSRLYPEHDIALLTARVLGAWHPLRDVDAASFPAILEQSFARTDPPAAAVPTPAIATYLGLQSATGFDTLVVAPPPARAASDAALIFLHGYAGHFYVYCWEAAQAAAAANLLTLCPTADPTGAWWTPDGERIFQATLDYAHRIGMNRIYLAGLSNGAAGASVLALAHQRDLSGLALISGTRAEHPPGIPTLVVHGASDELMPPSAARAYAARAPGATYREIPGGHLVFLSRFSEVRPLVSAFLQGLEQRAPGSPAFTGKAAR